MENIKDLASKLKDAAKKALCGNKSPALPPPPQLTIKEQLERQVENNDEMFRRDGPLRYRLPICYTRDELDAVRRYPLAARALRAEARALCERFPPIGWDDEEEAHRVREQHWCVDVDVFFMRRFAGSRASRVLMSREPGRDLATKLVEMGPLLGAHKRHPGMLLRMLQQCAFQRRWDDLDRWQALFDLLDRCEAVVRYDEDGLYIRADRDLTCQTS